MIVEDKHETYYILHGRTWAICFNLPQTKHKLHILEHDIFNLCMHICMYVCMITQYEVSILLYMHVCLGKSMPKGQFPCRF